nr:MAG TPA: hypothetical protein [Caudoviricetes sp.]
MPTVFSVVLQGLVMLLKDNLILLYSPTIYCA